MHTVVQNLPRRAITLRQPWATFAALGIKRFACIQNHKEARRYLGPLVIHASQKPVDYLGQAAIRRVEGWGIELPEEYPLGVSVGVVELLGTHLVTPQFRRQVEATQNELVVFRNGQVALEFCGALPCPYIQLQGKLGLWETPEGAALFLAKVFSGEIKSWDSRILQLY